MSPESFKYLLNVVGPQISKKDTRFRKSISAAERLCLTLHYLAYGGSQQSLSFSFRIAKSTISNIVNETCSAIWECLKDGYLRPPKTTDDWKNISKDFDEIWNLPHCVGAIDGKHVRIKAPIKGRPLDPISPIPPLSSECLYKHLNLPAQIFKHIINANLLFNNRYRIPIGLRKIWRNYWPIKAEITQKEGNKRGGWFRKRFFRSIGNGYILRLTRLWLIFVGIATIEHWNSIRKVGKFKFKYHWRFQIDLWITSVVLIRSAFWWSRIKHRWARLVLG